MDIATGTLVMLFFRVSGGFCWAIAGVLTARTLTVEDRGTYVAAVLGIGAATHLVGRLTAAAGFYVANQKHPVPEVVAHGLAIAAASTTLVLAGTLGAGFWVGGQDGLIIALVGIGLAPNLMKNVLGGVFLAEGRLGWHQLAAQGGAWFGVVLIAVWVLLLGHHSPVHAVSAWVAGHYLAFLISLAGSRGWIAWLRSNRLSLGRIRAMIAYGGAVTLVAIVAIVNFRLTQFFVLWFDGREGVGMYASAVTAAESLWVVAAALAGASFARIGGSDRDGSASLTARAVRHAIITSGFLGLTLFILAPIALPLVFGPEYSAAVTSARILAVGAVVFAPRASLWTYFTVQLGSPRIVFLLEVLSGVVSSAASVALIPVLGFVGAAWATLGAYILTISAATIVFARSSNVPVTELWRIQKQDVLSYWRAGNRLLRAMRARLSSAPLPAGKES